MDWEQEAKMEYVSGGTSYRKLAEKYNTTLAVIRSLAKRDGWVKLRTQAQHKADTKTVCAVANAAAKVDTSVQQAALKLLAAFERSVAAMDIEVMPPQMLKDYGAALKSIQAVIDSRPTELDIKEQQARIDKLRHEADRDLEAKAPISISLEGVEQYAE